jgi:hypothetical protein
MFSIREGADIVRSSASVSVTADRKGRSNRSSSSAALNAARERLHLLDKQDRERAARDLRDGALHSALNEELLMKLAGTEDLSSVLSFEIAVDTSESGAGIIGDLMTRLIELRLSDSILSTFRDLGTGLRNLRVLFVSRCGITNVDGITGLPSLTELYLSFNSVEDVSPLAMHDTLEVVDLEGNRVCDESALISLGMIPKLRALTLEGNPISLEPGYEDLVAANCQQLETLDDAPIRVTMCSDDEDSAIGRPGHHATCQSGIRASTPSSNSGSGSLATTLSINHNTIESDSKVNSPAEDNSRPQSGLSTVNTSSPTRLGGHSSSSSNSSKFNTVGGSGGGFSSGYSHEEYTIAQSLRTRGALGSDHEYLLTGASSPPDLSSGGRNSNTISSTTESFTHDKGASSSSSSSNSAAAAASLSRTRQGSSSLSSSAYNRRLQRPNTSSSTYSGGNKSADEGDEEEDDRGPILSDARRSIHKEGLGLLSSSSTSSMAYGRDRPETAGSTGSNFSFSSAESRPTTAQLTRQGSSSTSATAGGGGCSSDLTYGDASVVFVGNAARSLRMQRVGTASSLSSSVAHSTSFDMDPMLSSSSLELSGYGFGGGSTPAASIADQSMMSMMSAKSGSLGEDFNNSINVSTSTAPTGRSESGLNDNVRNRPSTAPVRGRSFIASSSSSVTSQTQQQQQQQPVIAAGGYAAALKLFLAAPTPGAKTKGGKGGPRQTNHADEDEDDDEDDDETNGARESKNEDKVEGYDRKENRPRRFSEDLHTFSMRDQLKSAGAASAMKAKAVLAATSNVVAAVPSSSSITTSTTVVAPHVSNAPIQGKASREASIGPGVEKSDEALIDMLKKKPKSVPEIHNRESFRRFFSGFPRARFLMLLQKADAMKRLDLVDDLLV